MAIHRFRQPSECGPNVRFGPPFAVRHFFPNARRDPNQPLAPCTPIRHAVADDGRCRFLSSWDNESGVARYGSQLNVVCTYAFFRAYLIALILWALFWTIGVVAMSPLGAASLVGTFGLLVTCIGLGAAWPSPCTSRCEYFGCSVAQPLSNYLLMGFNLRGHANDLEVWRVG